MADADRIRLAARVPADYLLYNYSPILADDMRALAGVGLDVAAGLAASEAAAIVSAGNAVLTAADRVAAAASAASAATTVPAAVDRVLGLRANDAPFWSMVRSTPTWGFGPNGVLTETAIDTVSWEFEPTTRAPLGVAFAGARTNLLVNPRYEGGTVGNIGSGGVMPSNVSLSATVAGVVYRVDAFGTLPDGQSYLDIKFSGTPSASGLVRVLHLIPNGTVFAASEVIAATVGYQLLAGTAGNFGAFAMRFTGITPSSNPTITTPSATVNRTVRLQTCSGSTVGANAGLEYMWAVTSGLAIDATIRYTLPQLQRGPFLSAPILPPVASPAISTRAQGTVSIPVAQLGTRYNYRSGTVIVDFSSQSGAFTSANDLDFFGVVSLGDVGANEVMGLLISHAHTSIVFRRTVSGVAQTAASVSITAPAAGQAIRAAFAWDLDAQIMQVAARGVAGTQVTGASANALPTITHLMPGRFSTTRALFGNISGLEIRPAAVFGASLAALT